MSSHDTILTQLEKFGLTSNEATIYIFCLQNGESSLKKISEECNIKRPTAYNYVENLVEKGILFRILKNGKTIIIPESPEKLHTILQKKKHAIEILEENLSDTVLQLKKLSPKKDIENNRDKEILSSIRIASEDNPNRPEFPADNPKFPATPTYKIDIPGFNNIWFKDESYNPTGTHKDRMAWEMVVTYRDFLRSKIRGHIKKLPQMSIITAGTAGFAIQTQLKKYGLPPLKCLLDTDTDPLILKNLREIGCEIYQVDLSKKELTWKEILSLTDNSHGIDITSAGGLSPTFRFYDWLSYEIINNSPQYCFIPFGTGNLYENVLNLTKREITTSHHDPRFQGDIEILRECHFIGATVNNPKSKAINLYSPHLPFVNFNEQWIKIFRDSGHCGEKSDVSIIQEDYLLEAIELAKKLNISAEPSGLGGLAMFLQKRKEIPKDAKILIVSTGKTKYGTL